jgi:hypothetical protein
MDIHRRGLLLSQEINDRMYRLLVHCLSTTDSFIYVLIEYRYHPSSAQNFKPSCGYLAVTPLGNTGMVPEDASYEDVVKFMRKGFSLPFPFNYGIRECFADVFG